MMKKWKYLTMTALVGSALFLGACGSNNELQQDQGNTNASETTNNETAQLTGSTNGDGSSTVAPIVEALVEEYNKVQPKVKVTSGVSGTGGGFKQFIAGETDFSNASRPIKDEEKALLEEAGIDYTEFKIANDGLTVVVNKENTWATDLTIDQLKQIWIEDGTTKKWSDIDPSWPAEEIVFYAPGADSGTYDYFDEVILEGAEIVKTNIQTSEDDNTLVTGVSNDKNAIGFFGYAYYLENQNILSAVKVNGVQPNNETIESGEYTPLSRPLFIYAKNSALKDNPAFYDFMKYTLENAGAAAEAVGYVKLQDSMYEEALSTLEGLK